MRDLGALVAVALLAAAPAAGEARFRDRAGDQPFQHVYAGGWEHFVGGGVSAFDCNGDLFPDLYVAGGDNPARLLVNTTPEAGAALAFAPLGSVETELLGVTGSYPLDIDGDGRLDLLVMRAGENVMLRGLGGCRFERANALWGFDGGDGWTTAFSATWEPGAAWPTLAVGNYVDRRDPEGPFRACAAHQLFRPKGAGYGPATELVPGYCALSMLFFDWNGRGTADLWISNDRHYYIDEGQEQLFRISPRPSAYGEAEGWRPVRLWGMGIASRDITGDGLPEVFITSMADQKLFSLAGDGARPSYQAVSYDRGTTAQRPYIGDEGRPSTGWHAEFGDVDNDGRDDLFITKGNVDQMPDAAMRDPDNLLMQQPDGRFVEDGAAAGIASFARGRGASLVDLNLDGLLDIVVVNRRAPMAVQQNVTRGAGNWAGIMLRQRGPNTMAVGGVIEVRSATTRQRREITVGGGHAGGRAGFEHFGLGADAQARYRVRWPDGVWSAWAKLTPGYHLVVTRKDGGTGLQELRVGPRRDGG